MYFDHTDKAIFWNNVSAAVNESGTTTDSNWHYWVITKAAGQAPIMYKDGTNVSANQSAVTFATTNDHLTIGTQIDNTYPFNGDIDEFAVYNKSPNTNPNYFSLYCWN